MKKHYVLNIKSYILITLYIVSIFLVIGENPSLKTFLITKIIGFTYFASFTYANFIRKQNI